MSTPAPPSLVAAFTFGGTPGIDYTVIPVPSQVSVSPELASFTTGFPPATRTPRTSGGIPPRGLDMNGILFMATAHIAYQAAGNLYTFNPDVLTVQTGYAIGAILRSAVTPTRLFLNTLDDNTADPDIDLTGWLPFNVAAAPTGVQSDVLVPGSVDDYPLDTGVGFLDLSPNTGAATVTGIANGIDGQFLIVTNVGGTYNLTLSAMSESSAPVNQLRLPADITLVPNGAITLRYSSALGLWVAAS